MIAGFFPLVLKVIWNAVVVLVCAGLIFIGHKANQLWWTHLTGHKKGV
jgi:hypothetical protein